MQKKGSIRLRILSLDIKNDFKLTGDYLLRIRHSSQHSDITLNNLNDSIWFDYSHDMFDITLTNRNMDNGETGVAQIKLNQIMKYPDCLHKIRVHLSAKLQSQWLQKQAAILILQLVYYSRSLQGKLKLIIVQANLTKDTQLLSQMDPYVKIKYGDLVKTTKVKDEAGKNPVWNQEFEIQVKNLSQRLQLQVLEKDVTTDDFIGSVQFKLRESNFLGTNKLQEHRLQLFDKKDGKKSVSTGFLKVKSLFTPISSNEK